MKILLCVLAMLLGTSSAWAMTLPTLPTPFAQQTRPAITGSTFTATTCANFKTALDSAAAASLSLNHVINVQAGLTCTLMYLPAHSGANGGWIIVRSANFANLPPAGTRVTLADAANMPVLTYGAKTNPYTGCGDEAALAASTNAQNYWIEGFDVEANTACPGCITVNKNYSLILTGYANCQYTNTKNLVFSHIIMRDQDANHILARGILCEMDKGGLALLDSYAVGIKSPPSDEAQALGCSNNPGPILLQNNFLQASTEVVIFGGAGALDAAHVPQDITVRLNDLSHDLAMRNPTNPWSLKTLLELKMGVRVLIEANTFKYAWTGVNGDDGHAFRFTVRSWGACATCFYFTGNQFGNPANPLCNTLPICPQSVAAVTDVTFRYNDTRHMGSAWSMFSSDDGNGGNSQPIARWYFHNNLFADFTYDATCLGGCGSMFDWANGGPYPALDILFEHNTFYNDGTVDSRIMNAGSAPIGQVSGGPTGSNPPAKTADMDFIFRNNIIQFGTYGIVGNTVNGPGALDSSFTTGALPNGYQWTNNVISGFAASGASMSTYVQGTRFFNNCYSTNGAKDGAGNAAMTVGQIGFDNPGNGDSNTFVLTNPAFKAGGACQATDGTDQGVNWTLYNAARSGQPVLPTQLWSPILDQSRATDWTVAGITGGIPARTTICPFYSGSPTPLPTTSTEAQINAALLACNNDGSTGGYVVPLAAGTFVTHTAGAVMFSPTFIGNGTKNVTLRGQGANQTFLKFSGGGNCSGGGGYLCLGDAQHIAAGTCGPSANNSANWVGNYTAGTTTILLDNVTGNRSPANVMTNNLAVGMYVILDQLDTPANGTNYAAYEPFVTNDTAYATNAPVQPSNTGRLAGQTPSRQLAEYHRVTNIVNNGNGTWSVTITPGLNYQYWKSGQSPGAWWCHSVAQMAYMNGVENLSIENMAPVNGFNGNVDFTGCFQCWMKGVRVLWEATSTVHVGLSANIEIRDSYIFGDGQALSGCGSAGTTYGISLVFAGLVLVENNIIQQQCSGMMIQPCFACVIAYNFTVGDIGQANNTLTFWALDVGHSGAVHNVLLEGNDSNGLLFDEGSAHGMNTSLVTVFRNNITGQQPGYSPRGPIVNQGYNRFNSYLGNVLGVHGVHNWYQYSTTFTTTPSNVSLVIFNIGICGLSIAFDCGQTNQDDPVTTTSAMRWGNFDHATDTIHWCGSATGLGGSPNTGWSTTCASTTEIPLGQFVPSTETLPTSFYLSSKPSWFGSSAFPVIGPDITGGSDQSGHVKNIPAKNCYLTVMGGPSNGSGSALSFNANTCYAGASVPAPPTGLQVQ